MSIADTLKDLILVNSPQYEAGDKKAKVVAICSQKGGVGKTTTAVNLGSSLAYYHGKHVLVIDLDPQGHVEKSLGAIVSDGIEYTPLSKVLEARTGNLLDAVVKTDLENFHLTPGDKALVQTESVLASRIGKEFILKRTIETAKTHYDIILIDCPPSLGNLTLNALVAADSVLIPCEMSVLAFEGVTDLLETLREVTERLNSNLDVLGVLFTRVDGRNLTMNQLILDNMKRFFNGKILKTNVTINTALNKAQLEGKPVFSFAPASSGASNYHSLADEVVHRLKNSNN
ncbi:MAG TPA: ParA family protein [bacterium]|nr:ParA family protein [bacterium]